MIHNSFYFILGRETKISQKEIESVLANFDFGLKGRSTISIISDDVLEIKLNASPGKVADLINVLGGTVKIFQKVAAGLENISEIFFNGRQKKIIFGISNYSRLKIDVFKLGLRLKKSSTRPLRVIAGKDNGRLSSAQSFQYKMDKRNIELVIFDTGIGRLIAVQDIEYWSKIDYGKPRSDARSGMLPPKLARMIVNIVLSASKSTRPLLVDPFCGSGNILIEGLTLGLDVMGSDISEKAVEDSKTNVAWFAKKRKTSIFHADATEFDFGKIDRDFVVVAEPFLGRPRKTKLTVEEGGRTAAEISKLYLDFLSNLKLSALPAGRRGNSSKLKAICLVFPLYELKNGGTLSIYKLCIDKIKNLGYILSYPPLIYGREYQVVKREIVQLKLAKHKSQETNLKQIPN